MDKSSEEDSFINDEEESSNESDDESSLDQLLIINRKRDRSSTAVDSLIVNRKRNRVSTAVDTSVTDYLKSLIMVNYGRSSSGKRCFVISCGLYEISDILLRVGYTPAVFPLSHSSTKVPLKMENTLRELGLINWDE